MSTILLELRQIEVPWNDLSSLVSFLLLALIANVFDDEYFSDLV